MSDKRSGWLSNRIFWLIALHAIGFSAALFLPEPLRGLVLKSTPIHLSVVALLMIPSTPDQRRLGFAALALCLVYGFVVEWIGVNTGWPFGAYRYGDALGPKSGGVPWSIGLNWFVVSLSARQWIPFRAGRVWQLFAWVLGSSALMVFLDMWIEPLAPELDYWYWDEGRAPVRNYLGWFGASVILQLVLLKVWPPRPNQSARMVFPIQLVFFVLLNALR